MAAKRQFKKAQQPGAGRRGHREGNSEWTRGEEDTRPRMMTLHWHEEGEGGVCERAATQLQRTKGEEGREKAPGNEKGGEGEVWEHREERGRNAKETTAAAFTSLS